MYVHHQAVVGGLTHHVVEPCGPAVARILHEARLDTGKPPAVEHGEQLVHLFCECMLVHIEPHAHAALLAVIYHTLHVDGVDNTGGVAVVGGGAGVPFPVVEHVGYVMLGAEIDVSQTGLGGERGAAHYLTGLHPRKIALGTRVEVEHDVVVLDQLAGSIGRHDDFPGRGGVCHHVHRAVHDAFERRGMTGARAEFSEAPVVGIGVEQGYPAVVGRTQCESALDRLGDAVDQADVKAGLGPLLAPRHRTGRESIVGEVADYLVEYGVGMFGQEVAPRDTLVVGAHLHVEAVLALVLAAHMQCGGVEAVAHGRALTIERMPHRVDRGGDSDRVYCEQVHPRVGLCQVALAQRHLPYPVVQLDTGARGQYQWLAVVVDTIG